jgi:hypothetical protein
MELKQLRLYDTKMSPSGVVVFFVFLWLENVEILDVAPNPHPNTTTCYPPDVEAAETLLKEKLPNCDLYI